MQSLPAASFYGQNISVKSKDLRHFLGSSLNSLGWKVHTPRVLKRVRAMKQERLAGMIRFNFSFEVEISYSENADGTTTLNYELHDAGDNKAGSVKCRQVLEALVATVGRDAADFAESREAETPPDTYGSARFAKEDELVNAGYIKDMVAPDVFLLAPYRDRFLCVPKAQAARHALVCGPTGAGKSSGFFIPNLVKRITSSVIVTEATAGDEMPELFVKTAGWRAFKGSHVYFFNPGRTFGTRINPMDKLKTADPIEFSAIADELAQLVITNTSPPTVVRSDPIWDKAERHLLWILMMHAGSSGDPKLANFAAIRELVRKSESHIRSVLANSKSPIAAEEFNAFVAHSSENFRHGVFSGVLQRLNPWLTDKVATMTETTDLSLHDLQQQLFSFYLSVPSRKGHLKPIAALVFNFLLDLALESQFANPLTLLLDEFTNFGAVPGIEDVLSIIRRRKIPVVLGVQSFEQIRKLYGREIAKIIVSQTATRVFFRPNEHEDAEEISRRLGDMTGVHEDTSEDGRTSVREFPRRLMTAAQLTTMPEDDVIAMLPQGNPVQLKRFTYETFPAPEDFDYPPFEKHALVKPGPFLPQAVAVQQAKEAQAKAAVTEEERNFLNEKQQDHAGFEEQRQKKRQQLIDTADWNIPG